MPKLKSHRGAAKRFRLKGDGKQAKRRRAFRNHILTKKGTKRKRQLRLSTLIKKCDFRAIKRLLTGS